jgi:hypothetical protein
MAIPTYKDIMLPFLRSLSDGRLHSLKELYQVLADCSWIRRAWNSNKFLLIHFRNSVVPYFNSSQEPSRKSPKR